MALTAEETRAYRKLKSASEGVEIARTSKWFSVYQSLVDAGLATVSVVNDVTTFLEAESMITEETNVRPLPESQNIRFLLFEGYEDTGFRTDNKEAAKAETARLQEEGKQATYVVVSAKKSDLCFGVMAKEGTGLRSGSNGLAWCYREGSAVLKDENIDEELKSAITEQISKLRDAIVAAKRG